MKYIYRYRDVTESKRRSTEDTAGGQKRQELLGNEENLAGVQEHPRAERDEYNLRQAAQEDDSRDGDGVVGGGGTHPEEHVAEQDGGEEDEDVAVRLVLRTAAVVIAVDIVLDFDRRFSDRGVVGSCGRFRFNSHRGGAE